MTDTFPDSSSVCIIGGGPAGLMAAEVLLDHDISVDLYDAMPSLGRKFLMAGKSGLNLTHAEPIELFLTRYGDKQSILTNHIKQFGPDQLRNWAEQLGIRTYVGSSKRVFPVEMKAAPLLRSWLHQLREKGLTIHVRHRWLGWEKNHLLFDTPNGKLSIKPKATLLALGGASWPKLGSTGKWQELLSEKNISMTPLAPANCGMNVNWSNYIKENCTGLAVKSVTLSTHNYNDKKHQHKGDFVITEYGMEGSLIYPFSSIVRKLINQRGKCTLYVDLSPDRSNENISKALSQPRGSNTWAKHLQRRLGIKGVKAKLLREFTPSEFFADPKKLATYIKALPITVHSLRPIDEAISSAGGIHFSGLDNNMMIKTLPGVFCAGEMLDWDAPTGGYLFTACFATGYSAGKGILKWLNTATTE